jgi:hypothetical protein
MPLPAAFSLRFIAGLHQSSFLIASLKDKVGLTDASRNSCCDLFIGGIGARARCTHAPDYLTERILSRSTFEFSL